MPEDRLLIPIRFGVDGAKADVSAVEGALDRTVGTVGRLASAGTSALQTALAAGGAATALVGALGGGTALGQFATGRQQQLERFFATSVAPDFSREAARQQLGGEVLGRIAPIAEALGLAGLPEAQIQRQLAPLARLELGFAEGRLRGRFAAQALVSREVDPRLSTQSLRDAVEEVAFGLQRFADAAAEAVGDLLGR